MVGYSLTSELRALSDLDEKAVYRTTTYTNAHNKRQLWEDVDTKYLPLWDSPVPSGSTSDVVWDRRS